MTVQQKSKEKDILLQDNLQRKQIKTKILVKRKKADVYEK